MRQDQLIRHGRRGLLWFGFWTLLGLLFAVQTYLTRSEIGSPVPWSYALIKNLADWYGFALLSLPALWLASRFPLGLARGGLNFFLHLAGSGLFSVGWMVLRTWVEQAQSRASGNAIEFSAAFTHSFVATFFFNVLIYWAVISVAHALDYYGKFQERERRAAELERRLTEARLHALQMQLNPHFLFNTLHAISALMHQDVEAADRMIVRLSELLRAALEGTTAAEVPLRQELAFLERYLDIERTRFGDRLTVQMHIDPETLAARVPNLILQPIVENAIQHGIEPHARPGRLELHARRQADELELQVRDNGAGLPAGDGINENVGLSNTRARLKELYGAAHRFEFQNLPEGGLLVRITIPFRQEAE